MNKQSQTSSPDVQSHGPTYPPGLAERVIAEVDSWDMSIAVNEVPAPYAEQVKPIYYGIGLKVARSAYEKIIQTSTRLSENYWDRTLNSAKKEFMKDYLLYHLSENGYDVEKTSKAMDCDPSHTYSLLKRMGLDIGKLREHRDAPMAKGYSEKRVNIDELVKDAEREILEYSGLLKESHLLNSRIKTNAGTIAQALVHVVGDYASKVFDDPSAEPFLELPYKKAVRAFEERYVRRVFNKTKYNRADAIRAMGFKDYAGLTNFLFNRGWTMRWFIGSQ